MISECIQKINNQITSTPTIWCAIRSRKKLYITRSSSTKHAEERCIQQYEHCFETG